MTENHHCRIVDLKDAGFRGTGNVRQGGRGAIVRRARAMGVSVATISRGVTRLEERLGARLFNRTSRQLALTDFGLTLAERAPRNLLRSGGCRKRRAWVAPILPSFFRLYPEVVIDLNLSDAVVDLVGDGFDAALRIAVLPDSSLVARKLCPVAPFIVASPAYLAEHGRPTHPRELDGHHCLGYAYRARQDTWRFSNAAGDEETVTPTGPLRVTNVDALVPTVLDGVAIAELPEFIASDYLADGRLEAS